MNIKEFTFNIRHLETSHPLLDGISADKGDLIYQELAKKWFKELSLTDQKKFKLINPFLEVYGGVIF